MNIPTYTARYLDTNVIIYERMPHGNLFGQLPLGTWPISHPDSSLERVDGGDPFERCLCETSTQRRVVISRDPEPVPLRIVAVVGDDGLVTLYSNCRTLAVEVLDTRNPDPESTDSAEARLVREALHPIEEIEV